MKTHHLKLENDRRIRNIEDTTSQDVTVYPPRPLYKRLFHLCCEVVVPKVHRYSFHKDGTTNRLCPFLVISA